MCDYDAKTDKYSPDRMDALVWGFTELMTEAIAGEGWLAHAAAEAAKATKKPDKTTGPTVRVKSPQPFAQIQVQSGRNYTTDAVGFVDMAEEDAASAIAARWTKVD
jgi:hypothetical protein